MSIHPINVTQLPAPGLDALMCDSCAKRESILLVEPKGMGSVLYLCRDCTYKLTRDLHEELCKGTNMEPTSIGIAQAADAISSELGCIKNELAYLIEKSDEIKAAAKGMP